MPLILNNDVSFEELDFLVQDNSDNVVMSFKKGVYDLKSEYYESLNEHLSLLERNQLLRKENQGLIRQLDIL